jgi:superfamily II DNA or RNA helicase
MSPAKFRLGLTATPLLASKEVPSQLPELVGPVVFELALSDLTGTYLSDFDYFTLTLNLDSEERFQYENEMAVYKKIQSEFKMACPQGNYMDWIRFASRTAEGRNALQALRKAKHIVSFCKSKATILYTLLEKHWSQKTLIFTSDTEIAYRIAIAHMIMPITSEIGRKEREQMLQYYRSGEIRALVSCRVLNEGLDVPDAEVAIITGGTSGAREHIQRIGRILRPYRGKKAVIYELVCQNTIEVRQSQKRSHSLGQATPTSHQFSPNYSNSNLQKRDWSSKDRTTLLHGERPSLGKVIL